MGGFMIDGCGVADSFYVQKELGQYICPNCRKLRQFTLSEVKRKIRILYIPTISYSTRYAVICKGCETGYYIENEDRDDIMNGCADIEMTESGMRLVRSGKTA